MEGIQTLKWIRLVHVCFSARLGDGGPARAVNDDAGMMRFDKMRQLQFAVKT